MGSMIYRYLPYWPLFVLLFVVALGGAIGYLRYTTPLYESTARILIKDEKKGAEESKAVESMDMLSTKKIIENEVEVIQSKTLIDEVVKRLRLYAPVYEKGSVKNASAYATSPVIIEVDSVNKLKEVKNVYFSTDAQRSKIVIQDKEYPINQWVSTPYGTLRFLQNKDSSQRATKQLFFSLVKPKKVVADIANRLKVSTASKLSSILNLSLADEVPERGEDILNELLIAYNVASIHDKNTLAGNTLNFIQERLVSVERDLDSIQRKVQHYRSQTNAIDIGTQGKLYLQNVSNNDQKLGEINMQLAVLNQVETFVTMKDQTSGIVPSNLGVNDPTLSHLVDKLYSSELEYESLKKNTGANNPLLVSLTDRIEKIKPSILENIRSQRRSLQASRDNLTTTNNMYASTLRSIPEKERQLIDINRDQGTKNEIYNFLLQKREETALSHASTVSDSRVVDKAVSSDKPVSPKRKVVLLSSFLIALLGGLGIIYTRETFNSKIMFRHEIESLTERPIIGEISSESSKDPIVIGEDKRTFIAEQFRRLRATLNYIGVNSKRKKILVTSSISGEGKSFVATNLALSLAITGKRVVLLDFDLNNPSLNNKLNISEDTGITDYLLEEADVENIIRQTELHKNLYLIPTGKLPANPCELIMNGRVELLLSYLNDRFDYIVMDTAPVSPVTDAYILSAYCDATLYVIRHGYTPKTLVQRIDANNKLNHLNNMAIVFNGVTPRGFGYKNHGYGYGYGYVYADKKEGRKRLTSGKNQS